MDEPNWKGFGMEVFRDWPDVGELDGFDLQELGYKHGILRKVQRTTPCGPGCNCDEYAGSGEEVDCFVREWIKT